MEQQSCSKVVFTKALEASVIAICMNNSLTTLRHAVHKLAKQFGGGGLPLLCHHVLQSVLRGWLALLDASRHVVPQVLDGVEVRRVGREVEAADAVVVQPGLRLSGSVSRRVVPQQPPLPVSQPQQL